MPSASTQTTDRDNDEGASRSVRLDSSWSDSNDSSDSSDCSLNKIKVERGRDRDCNRGRDRGRTRAFRRPPLPEVSIQTFQHRESFARETVEAILAFFFFVLLLVNFMARER
mgnify:CR=1 FL=1|tara:strand:- start:1202 stop:1537 length:336 start_codon:yes stop_codon:yes gene_type:complete